MQHDRKLVEETLSQLEEQKTSTQEAIWNEEMAIVQEISQIEKAVQAYNQLAASLKLADFTVDKKSVSLQFNSRGSTVKDMTKLDLNKVRYLSLKHMHI